MEPRRQLWRNGALFGTIAALVALFSLMVTAPLAGASGTGTPTSGGTDAVRRTGSPPAANNPSTDPIFRQALSSAALPSLSAPQSHGYLYPDCPTTTTHDTITINGVQQSDEFKGSINVEYIMPDESRQSVPQSVTYAAVTHDSPFSFDLSGLNGTITFTTNYPPSSQWPLQPNGTKEIHVDIAIEVYQNGDKVETLGPGQPFDVFCVNNPTPTSTPNVTTTATSTSTPTNTPNSTSTPTATPTNSPTSTPTSTFTAIASPTSTATSSPIVTDTATAIPTNTQVPTDTPTGTRSPTLTPAPTDTPTGAQSPTMTATATSTPTNTPTNAPSQPSSPTPTSTPVPSSSSPPSPPSAPTTVVLGTVATPLATATPVPTALAGATAARPVALPRTGGAPRAFLAWLALTGVALVAAGITTRRRRS